MEHAELQLWRRCWMQDWVAALRCQLCSTLGSSKLCKGPLGPRHGSSSRPHAAWRHASPPGWPHAQLLDPVRPQHCTQGVGGPACARILTTWFASQERGTYWGMWNIAHNLGGFLAPLIAGGFAKAMGWKWGMWAPGIIGLAVGIFVLVAV